MAYVLTDINTSYVDENKMGILRDIVLGAPSIDEFHKVPNVKGPFNLHIMTNEIVFQDASSCGFEADGNTTYSDVTLTPAALKVNMEWCHKDMLSTFAEYDVNITAGEEQIAHEQLLMNDIAARIAAGVETMIWQGDSTSGDAFDGIGKVTGMNAVTLGGTDIIADVNAVYTAIPEEVLDKAVIYMSKANFRKYIMALTAANMYHYNPAVDGNWTVTIPGTNTRIKALPGLKGVTDIYALVPDEVVYGFDNEDGYATLDFWYSRDNDTFRLNCQFMAGVAVAFVNHCVKGSVPTPDPEP